MNQIIIIGNGFDLAHNLKTSYSDLLLFIFKNLINDGYKKHFREDYLSGPFRVNCSTMPYDSVDDFLSKMTSLEKLISHEYIHHDIKSGKALFFWGDNEGGEYQPKARIKINIESEFIKSIILKQDISKWVDVENEYFNHLNSILKGSAEKEEKRDKIIKLNHDLDYLKLNLIQHLKDQINHFDIKYFSERNPDFQKKLKNLINPKILFESGSDLDQRKYKRLIVNYNYTSLIDHYQDKADSSMSPSIINIHGSIKDGTSDIIFGFGSVQSQQLENILTSEIRESTDNLKHVQYHLNGQNKELNDLIDKGAFTVRIIGHSCGPSDGTTLRKIFEHKNCKKISVAFLNSEELKEKIFNIYFHLHKNFKELDISPMSLEYQFPQV